MIPGFSAAPMMVGSGASFPEITFIGSAVSFSSVQIPVAAQVGDIAFLNITLSYSITDNTPPSGWTEIGVPGTGYGNHNVVTAYRVLTSGDPGSYVFGGAANSVRRRVLVFRSPTGMWGEPESVVDSPDGRTLSAGDVPYLAVAFYSLNSSAGVTFGWSPGSNVETLLGGIDTTKYRTFNKGDGEAISISLSGDPDWHNITSFRVAAA